MPGMSPPPAFRDPSKAKEDRQRPAALSQFLLLSLFILILALAGTWILANGGGKDSLDRVRAGGALRIGYAVEAPYAFVDSAGQVTGADPALAEVLARRIGIEHIEWRRYEFGSLIGALEGGEIDVIAAGMFVTPNREKRVLFAHPSIAAKPGLLTQRGRVASVHSYPEAVAAGLRLAALEGSVEEVALSGLGLPSRLLIRVPDAQTGFLALRSGLAEALALSAPTLRWLAAHDASGSMELIQPFDSAGGPGIGLVAQAFRRGDIRLKGAWDRALDAYLSTEAHRALVAPFGFVADDLPVAGAVR